MGRCPKLINLIKRTKRENVDVMVMTPVEFCVRVNLE
jgi:hypothetical protein